ncbi:MAG: hypothetical protein IKT68_01050 [Clostridia bacterium]|nr:hypothetical protein [Clostridia bacterium]
MSVFSKQDYQSDRSDSVAVVLWNRAKQMEHIGEALFALLLLFGIYQTIANGVTAYQNADMLGDNDQATVACVLEIFSSLFFYAICLTVEYVVYHLVVLLLGSQARMVENTANGKHVAVVESKDPLSEKRLPPLKSDHFQTITCPDCNKQLFCPTNVTETVCPYCERSIRLTPRPIDNDPPVDIDIEHFVDADCPYCGQRLSYPKGTVHTQCPHCDKNIQLKY